MTTGYKHAAYLEYIRIEQLRKAIARSCKFLKKKGLAGLKFDTIAFRGVSGLLLGPPIALKLKKEMIVVRKSNDNHSCHDVEGYQAAKKYLIVDDLIASGNTAKTIKRGIKEFAPEAECIGVLQVNKLMHNPNSPFAIIYDGECIAI